MSIGNSAGEELLLRYHARYPGATVATFADARDAAKRSPYQRLVDDVAALQPRRVLDLACGDGYLLERLGAPGRVLTGVDMSVVELDAARRRLGSNVELVEARAVALPFDPASFEAVVSHLALMLMENVDRVLAEIARVLTARGWCFAIVGIPFDGPPPAMMHAVRDVWLACAGSIAHTPPALGDPRMNSIDGIATLFAQCGFDECEIERVVLHRAGTARELAEHHALFYQPASLPDDVRADFIEKLTKAFVGLERDGATLTLQTSVAHIRARTA